MAGEEPKRNVLERIKERQAAARKKFKKRLVRVGAGLVVFVAVLAILYPYLQVVWHMRRAQGSDPEMRMKSLQWLAGRKVRSSIPLFVKALDATRSESYKAFEVLGEFKDPSIIPELLKIWNDRSTHAYAKYNALQLVADLGDKDYMDTFISTRVMLSARGWEAAYDFLNKHADEQTVQKLLTMLNSGDTEKELASAMALNYIRKKPFVRDNGPVKDALCAKVDSPDDVTREESIRALIEIADENQLPSLLRALDDKDTAVCCYAAMAISYMKPEVAEGAVPKLLEKLLHPDGEICMEAAQTLGKIRSKTAVPRLLEILRDQEGDSFARQNAVKVLKVTGDPRGRGAITSALSDPDADVAKTAALALIRVGDKNSVAPLVELLKNSRSHKVRIVAAYVLGMLGEPGASGALLDALKRGDPELSKVAGAALLRIAAREVTPGLARVCKDTEAPPVVRREALLVLSKFRTASSLCLAIDALADAQRQLREEARDSLVQLTSDLLEKEKLGFGPANAHLAQAAASMLQKKIGAELREDLASAEGFDVSNKLVLAAVRRLDERNKPDLDLLGNALEEARAICWNSALREELTSRGLSEEKMASAASSLRSFVLCDYVAEEPPTPTLTKIVAEFRKRFALSR